MIKLDERGCLPDGTHDIVGKLQEIVMSNDKIEEFCKDVIKNEFMDRVDEWDCDFEDILDEEVGLGSTYAEALANADWNCTKYYVHFDENDNVRLFKVLDIKENSTNDVFKIKNNNDNTYDFHLKFTADEDEVCCLSMAMDHCQL